MSTQFLEKPTESSFNIDFPINYKYKNFIKNQRVTSGLAYVVMSAALISNMTPQYNVPTSNHHVIAKTQKSNNVLNSRSADRIFSLGTYISSEKLAATILGDDEIEFAHAVHVMENLDDTRILNSKKATIFKVSNLKITQGKIIPPEEDDFNYEIDFDTL